MRLAIVTLFAATTISGAAMAAEPTGDWRTEDGSAIIRVDNCRGALWGVVAWEKEPGRDKPQRPADAWQPGADQHARVSQARWDGQIYNATNGQTYNAHVTDGRREHAARRRLRPRRRVLRRPALDARRRRQQHDGRGAKSDVCSRVSQLSPSR